MVEEIPRTEFKMPITSQSLSTANNSPYQHRGILVMNFGALSPRCISDAQCFVAVGGSGLSFLPKVDSFAIQLENIVISFLLCFCFDLLNCVYNWLCYMKCYTERILIPSAFVESFCLSNWFLYLLGGLLIGCLVGCLVIIFLLLLLVGWLVGFVVGFGSF